MALLDDVIVFAQNAHYGQFRKDGYTPYFEHPKRVALMVTEYPSANKEMIAAAFLHDVMEDCGVTYENLKQMFGSPVADLVQWLTNPSKGSKEPRAVRKTQDREHIKSAPLEAKVIKLFDRLDNLQDAESLPSDFRKLYVKESEQLLEVLTGIPKNYLDLLKNRIESLKNG